MADSNLWLQQMRQRVPDLATSTDAVENAKAAVLMAFTDAEHGPELILTRRSLMLRSHAGEVAFPGGKRDETDPDLAFTVLREAQEEIALPPALVELIGPLPPAVSRWGLHVTPFVGIIPHRIALTPNESEIDSIFRVPLRYFLEAPVIEYTEREHEGVSYRIPAFHYENQVIWGLTAYFIAEFCNRVFGAGFEYFRPRPIVNSQ